MPFYAWECVTLVLKDREIDLVIPNEQRMNQFLKLISYKIQALDGTKDSAVKLKNEIFKKRCRNMKKSFTKDISEESKKNLLKEINHQIMMKTMMRYTIMKVRSKISFHAYVSRLSI